MDSKPFNHNLFSVTSASLCDLCEMFLLKKNPHTDGKSFSVRINEQEKGLAVRPAVSVPTGLSAVA